MTNARTSNVTPLLILLTFPALARADGGRLLVSRPVGPYRVAVFASPPAARAGVVDFSVLVQSHTSDTPLDVTVTVTAANAGRRVSGSATTAAATNKLFRAVALDLPTPGPWHILVEVGDERLETELTVSSPLPSWLDLAAWIGWPAAAVALFLLHRLRTRRAAPGVSP